MRSTEPIDPEVAAALQAIDATLDGEPVDPEFAELAELSLILRDEAPAADGAYLARLDTRVRNRFAAPSRPRSAGSRMRAAAAVLATVGVAAAAVVVVDVADGTHGSSRGASSAALPAVSGTATSSSGAVRSPHKFSGSFFGGSGTSSASGSSSAPPAAPVPRPAAPRPTVRLPTPASQGRDIARSAQLSLQAGAGQIDAVAQAVFAVVGAEHGSVTSSRVTSLTHGPSSAMFSLRVPSARLESALDRLSHLTHARVVSREDASTDISAQIGGAGTQLADARAVRRALLHELADADTTGEIDHLQTQLHANESVVAADEVGLARLHGRVSDSTIAVSVNAPPLPPRRRHHTGSGFTIHRALLDAGHVLLVAAGVLLIALAVLIPLTLVVALIAWVWALTLRRRREGALES